jgi:26S proteasome regulatory subunit N2
MGTARQDVYDLLKTNLYQDDAVTGEPLFLGTGNLVINILVMFLHAFL